MYIVDADLRYPSHTTIHAPFLSDRLKQNIDTVKKIKISNQKVC